jgi:hypothetical protein
VAEVLGGLIKRLTEAVGVFNAVEPKDYGSVGVDADSVAVVNYRHISYVCSFGAITGNSILTVYSGATEGAKTTPESFRTRLTSAVYKAAASDAYAAEQAAVTTLTLTAATYTHRILVVEVDINDITQRQPWVTLSVDATATVLLLSVSAILSQARFAGTTMPSADIS